MYDMFQLAVMGAAGGVGGLIYWAVAQRKTVLARARRAFERR